MTPILANTLLASVIVFAALMKLNTLGDWRPGVRIEMASWGFVVTLAFALVCVDVQVAWADLSIVILATICTVLLLRKPRLVFSDD